MKNYLYRDNETGEEFYVQADCRYQADEIAQGWFNDPKFLCIHNDEAAERYGYDTYTE